MKTIAIVGAGGFVGKNLCESLCEDYRVYAITRTDFDLTDSEQVCRFFEQHTFDTVINCANQGGARNNGYAQTDVIGNNLKIFFNLERCLNDNTKLINFGSGAQYNKQRNLIEIKECDIGQILPIDDYGFSKYVMSRYISANQKDNIYNPIIFGLYGKYEDYTYKFISNAIVKNLLKMPIVINQNVEFDYLFIDDFVQIIRAMIEDEFKNREFNITPDQSIDLYTIAQMINHIGNHQSEIQIRNEGMNYTYTGDNSLLKENLHGSFKFTSYEDGITQLYQYYKEHIEELDLSTIYEDKAIQYCQTNRRGRNNV